MMLEQVDGPSYTRWLPEQTVSFTTHHTRLNPLELSEDAADISKVAFHLSPNPTWKRRLFWWNSTAFKTHRASAK